MKGRKGHDHPATHDIGMLGSKERLEMPQAKNSARDDLMT